MAKAISIIKIFFISLLIANVYNQNMSRAFEKIMEIRNRLFNLVMDRVNQVVKKDEVFDGLQRDYLNEYGIMDYPTYKRDFYESPKYAENEILYALNLSDAKRRVIDKFYDDLWAVKGKKWEFCLQEIKSLFAKSEDDLRNILL